jgi:Fe-Mn family superoxide dismutase
MNSFPSQNLSRRDVLKTLGAGAVMLGLGALGSGKAAEIPVISEAKSGPMATSATLQPFTLPKLEYAYDALEPHIDTQTMQIHHGKHHQAYIDNANKALRDFPELKGRSGEELLRNLADVPESIRASVRNQVGGHLNHSFFWRTIGPSGPDAAPSGALSDALNATFGSFNEFKTRFADAAMKRFGSGWAWLSIKGGKLQIHSTANQDSPYLEGAVPVLALDVWEHAYYLHYQNRRAEYVAAFWRVVNWKEVSRSFAVAMT